MKKSILIVTGILLVGCGATKPSVDEQIAQQYDPNKDIQLIEIDQSHGLIGDLMDSTFKTITGKK